MVTWIMISKTILLFTNVKAYSLRQSILPIFNDFAHYYSTYILFIYSSYFYLAILKNLFLVKYT